MKNILQHIRCLKDYNRNMRPTGLEPWLPVTYETSICTRSTQMQLYIDCIIPMESQSKIYPELPSNGPKCYSPKAAILHGLWEGPLCIIYGPKFKTVLSK